MAQRARYRTCSIEALRVGVNSNLREDGMPQDNRQLGRVGRTISSMALAALFVTSMLVDPGSAMPRSMAKTGAVRASPAATSGAIQVAHAEWVQRHGDSAVRYQA